MSNSNYPLVPRFTTNIYADVPDDDDFDHLVHAIQYALGVQFEPDLEGRYEEINALVSRPFGYTLAVYHSDDLSLEESPTTHPQIMLQLVSWIPLYELGLLETPRHEPAIDLSLYLAHVLTMKTAYRFHAYPFDGSATEPPEMEIPLLNAVIQAFTPESPTAYLAPVCQALGVPTDRLQPVPGTPGDKQQLGATLLGHTLRFVLTEAALSVGGMGMLQVEVSPSADTQALAQDGLRTTPVPLSIDAFLARLVSEATGLPFAASTAR